MPTVSDGLNKIYFLYNITVNNITLGPYNKQKYLL